MARVSRGSDVHIDGGEGTVCYRAADGAGKGESGVEGNAALLAGRIGGGGLDGGIGLDGTGGRHVGGRKTQKDGEGKLSGVGSGARVSSLVRLG